ncbi:TPA: hypothetical protein L5D83_003157 [Pseudomonas aeruginosa]|uniref:Uncharacterized protein n=1 Tax=Pseudomonas phage PA_L9 TaxID=3232177 RepID=A0AAU8KYH3_9CAUD|nr:hypothetical protein [Pseudomonas aeruginosa]
MEKLKISDLESGDITLKILASVDTEHRDYLRVLHRLGLFRLRTEADSSCSFEDLCGDSYNPEVVTDIDADELKKQKEKFRREVKTSGVWGVILEARPSSSVPWEDAEHVDSIWGFVGTSFQGSGYDGDMLALAYEWLAQHSTDEIHNLYVQCLYSQAVLAELSDRLPVEECAILKDIQARLSVAVRKLTNP